MLLRAKWLLLISLFSIVILPCRSLAGREFFAGDFLHYQYSMRAQSMGVFGIALPARISPEIYNPALLALDTELRHFSSYSGKLFWDDVVNDAAFTFPVVDGLSYGIKYLRVGVSGIEEYTENEKYLGTFGAVQQYLGVAVSKALSEGKTAVGFRIGAINEDYNDYSVSSWDLTVGAYEKLSDEILVAGVVTNVNNAEIGNVKMAMSKGIGISYVSETGLLVTAEVIYNDTLNVGVNYGAEYSPLPFIAFRAGNCNGQIAGGIGLSYGDLGIDYTYKPHVLSDSHFVALSFAY